MTPIKSTRLAVVIAASVALSGAATFAGCGSSNGAGAGGGDDAGDATGDVTSDGPSGTDATTDGPSGSDGPTSDAKSESGSSSGGDSGGADSAVGDSGGHDGGAPGDAGGDVGTGVFGDGGTCVTLGDGCMSSGDCCSGSCTGGVCAYPTCGSVGQACTGNAQCCSQTCTNGSCASLNGGACSTLGNSCTGNAQCCSNNCALGVCQPASWCGQTNDICSKNADCCSGSCTIPSGQSVGVCAAAAPGGNCTSVDGQLCTAASFVDGGCGGSCCSRLCAPWGPTGVEVCQPATGCHVEGDTCTSDGECCGSQALIDAGLPTSGHAVVCMNGYCTQHMGCTPNGDVCKLMTTSCNANQDCCAGLGNANTACRQDNVGVPRCASAQCADGGGACATSADCCNGDPCVPNPGGNPPYICANTLCVPSCSPCSTTSDCCTGYSCINGVCDPCGGTSGDGGAPGDGGIPGDGGTTGDGGAPGDSGILNCAQFGQLCDPDAGIPCCTGPGLACRSGRCEYN